MREWESFVVNSGYKYVGETDLDLIFEYNGFDFKCNKYKFPPKKISIRQCLTPIDYCVSKFNKVHNNYYTYDNFEWVGKVSDYGVFTCPTHGDFKQIINNHLRGLGCFKCFGSEKLTEDVVLKRCIASRGDKYDYSNLKYEQKGNMITICCRNHGEFTTNFYSHTKGVDCKLCVKELSSSRVLPTELFIEKAKNVHGDFYDYGKTDYSGAKELVIVTCKIHGDFEQVANYHLTGNGCQVCGLQKTGFTKTAYTKACKSGSSVYILKLKKDDECFYKIGISKNIKNRINGIVCESGYLVECVYSEFFKDSSVTFDVEKILHNKFREFKYKPEISFSGSSECFNMNDHSFVVEFLKGVVL